MAVVSLPSNTADAPKTVSKREDRPKKDDDAATGKDKETKKETFSSAFKKARANRPYKEAKGKTAKAGKSAKPKSKGKNWVEGGTIVYHNKK